jgi:hypothetical protein
MAFPVTPILESGTGTDVSPLTTFTDGPDGTLYGGFRRISNQLASITTDSYDWYNPAQYGPDSEVYATFAVLTAAATMGEFGCKTTNVGTSVYDQYLVSVRKTEMRLYIIQDGVYTQLGAALTQTFSAGDSAGLVCTPGSQVAYYKSGAGAWTVLGTRTDVTFDAVSGYLTIYLADTTGRLTNFGGGAISVTNAPETLRVLASPLRW